MELPKEDIKCDVNLKVECGDVALKFNLKGKHTKSELLFYLTTYLETIKLVMEDV